MLRLLIFCCCVPYLLICCSSGKEASPGQSAEKKLPGTVSPAPGTFRCEVIPLAMPDSDRVILVVQKIIEQGAALFYAVNSGDTIETVFIPSDKINFEKGITVQVVIEERLKLNSELPEFRIRKVY